jgi:hypothetical protein
MARVVALVPLLSFFISHKLIVAIVSSTVWLAHPPSLDPEE